jgi:hypothetical protein
MYKFEQNPVLKNEISIYKNNQLVASINKANFENDYDAFDFAEYLVKTLNN